MNEQLRPFFENRNLLVIVDRLAQAYGKTPFEILTCMTIYEFSLNVAIFASARIEEDKNREKDPEHPIDGNIKNVPLSSFPLERIVKEK